MRAAAAEKPRFRRRADGSTIPLPRQASNLPGPSFPSGYEAAQWNRRLSGFQPTRAAINSLLVLAGPTLRARARYLVRNNPYARKAMRVFVTHLVGTGIRAIPKPTDPALKAKISQLLEDWTDEADADGQTDFYGLQVLAAREMFQAGECFVRFRPRRSTDGLSVPLQLQLLGSEYLDYALNRLADNGNEIRSGIEFNAIGQRVAYWFWRRNPGEIFLPNAVPQGYTRVLADQVVHLYEQTEPGQIRGVSWLAAAIVRAFILDQYDDAELERKKTAALFAGFITQNAGGAKTPLGSPSPTDRAAAAAAQEDPQEMRLGLSPGILQILFPGESISFSSPADVGPNFEAFEYRALLGMCAGFDLPYASVTGDISKATYASSRAALLDLRAAVEQIQHTVLVFQFCRSTYQRWMNAAVVAGALPIAAGDFTKTPRDFLRVKWQPPRFPWIDPLKDVQADRIAVRSGFESRTAIAAARGYDLEELDGELELDNESADQHGLVLDSDPRRTDFRGSASAPDTTAPKPSAPAPNDPTEIIQPSDDEEEDDAA